MTYRISETVMLKCPPHISIKHWEEWVGGSGVSPEITFAAIESLSNGKEIASLMNYKGWRNGGGWIVRGVDPKTGERRLNGAQFKPDNPSIELDAKGNPKLDKQGNPKVRKYLSRSGNESAPLFLPVPSVPDYWAKVLEDDTIPLFITEGGKKAGCLLTHGLACISIPGVNCGQKFDRLDDELAKLAPGRQVDLVFDADWQTNPSVVNALKNLSTLLRHGGAIVRVIVWDLALGKGADDFITAHGFEAFQQAIENAPTFKEWAERNPDAGKYPDKEGVTRKDGQIKGQITQSEFARIAVERWGGTIAYDMTQNDWLKYEAKHPGVWSTVSDDHVKGWLNDLASETLADGYSASLLDGSFKIAKSDKDVRKDCVKSSPECLVFRNTTLNIRTAEVIGHSPENHARWALNRDYDPNAKNWEPIARWLNGALIDKEDQDRLVAFHAATIRDLFQKLEMGKNTLVQQGESGAGKGTSTRLIRSLVGQPNIQSFNSIEELMDQFGVEGLEDSPRIILFPDLSKLPPNLKIDKFLILTGRDEISIARKHKKKATITYTGGVVINTTDCIFSAEHYRRGMARRTVYLDSFAKNPALQGIEKEFTEECLAAYTNFLLGIPEEEIIETLANSPSHPGLNTRQQSDTVVSWFASCVQRTGKTQTLRDGGDEVQLGNDKDRADQLFGSYFQYCRRMGIGESFIKGHARFRDELIQIIEQGKKEFGWKVEKITPGNKLTFRGLKLIDREKIEDSPEMFLVSLEANLVSLEVSHQTYIQQGLVSQLASNQGFQKKIDPQNTTREESASSLIEENHEEKANKLTKPVTASVSGLTNELTKLASEANYPDDPNQEPKSVPDTEAAIEASQTEVEPDLFSRFQCPIYWITEAKSGYVVNRDGDQVRCKIKGIDRPIQIPIDQLKLA